MRKDILHNDKGASLRRCAVFSVNFSIPNLKASPDPRPIEDYYRDPETLATIADFFALGFQAFGYAPELEEVT